MEGKFYKILLGAGIAGLVTASFVFWFSYSVPKNLEVDFLDVGQGDAMLVKTPYGQNILIDGGPDNSVVRRLSENLSWWDRQIDLMILTHPHDDHVSGLNDVIDRFGVKEILYTGVVDNAPSYLAWLNLIRDKKIPLVIIDKPQTIKLGQDCRLDILYPTKSFLNYEVENLNNSSIVAKLIYGQKSFLFMGDAEKEVENELLKQGVDLKADILKAGHHGSDTSSGENFLKAVNPKTAVVEVGADNDFGHPNERILRRLERAGANIFRTDLDGTVKIFTDGEKVEINGK